MRQTNSSKAWGNFTQHSDEPTWLIDFDYTPNDETLLYAKYARGYRAGATFANISPPSNLVRPERVDAYEIGSKLTFGGDISGAFNTAVFYNDFENQQLSSASRTTRRTTSASRRRPAGRTRWSTKTG